MGAVVVAMVVMRLMMPCAALLAPRATPLAAPRRGLTTTVTTTTTTATATARPLCRPRLRATGEDQRWSELTPAGPYFREGERRGTVLREVVPGRVWAVEQVQGAIFVHVPVRMSLVKLDEGGLLAYSAVAPTREMLALVATIEAQAGPLRHVVLPTTAIEHKLFAVALARRRRCPLWVVPDQFAFPLNLPNALLGFPRATYDVTAVTPPWAAQFDSAMLGPFKSKDGISNFEEFVMHDRASRTLLVCDLLVSVPEDPPDVVLYNDRRALLYHSRDGGGDDVADTVEARRDGWRKIALFSLFFQASPLEVGAEPDGTLRGVQRFFAAAFPPATAAARAASGRWDDFFAWTWPSPPATRAAFDKLRSGGRLLVPPILQVAILDRDPPDCLRLARTIEAWHPKQVVPCHFDAPVPMRRGAITDAFAAFLVEEQRGGLLDFFFQPNRQRAALPPEDLAFLRTFADTLLDAGVIFPPKPKLTSVAEQQKP